MKKCIAVLSMLLLISAAGVEASTKCVKKRLPDTNADDGREIRSRGSLPPRNSVKTRIESH